MEGEVLDHVRTVSAEALRPGIKWLTSEQAEDAVVSHHGISSRVGSYSVTVCPQGPSGRSGTGAVLVFDLREYSEDPDARDGIGPAEREALRQIVEEVAPVLSAWNGTRRECTTCSFHIDVDPGPGIRRAKRNYVPFKRDRWNLRMPEGWY